MSARISFFALKHDILSVTAAVESTIRLKYAESGQFAGREHREFERASDIPGIGTASSGSATACDTFLVVPASAAVKRRPLSTLTVDDVSRAFIEVDGRKIIVGASGAYESVGAKRYAIDQRHNPDSITFCPAGRWADEVLIGGTFATAHPTPQSKHIFKAFRDYIRQTFKSVNGCFIGKEAQSLIDSGVRFTFNASSPREYDLHF